MNSYCFSCKNIYIHNYIYINPKIVRTKNNRLMMLSKGAICNNKTSKFIKEQEARGLLSNLGVRTPLSKIPLLNVLFLTCFALVL